MSAHNASPSKFSGLLPAKKSTAEAAVPPAPPGTAVVSSTASPRATSKSKDPAWKPFTLILKKETHAEASYLLKKLDTGEDMSELAQRLFEDWIKAHK
jgi:hypothetical protein